MRATITLRQRYAVLMRDHFTCIYCGRRPPMVYLEVDHFHPVAAGGGNEDSNLATACRDCNAGKADQVWIDQYSKRGEWRYRASCECERPTCGGPFRARDGLELDCDCKGCHGCDICGSIFCQRANVTSFSNDQCEQMERFCRTGDLRVAEGLRADHAADAIQFLRDRNAIGVGIPAPPQPEGEN